MGRAHPPHDADDASGHASEPFPRQLTAQLVAGAEAARRLREALPVWVLAAGLAALALGLPCERLWGHLHYLPAAFEGRPQPYALQGLVARWLASLFGTSGERAWYLVSALAYGAALPALFGLARGVGFDARAALLAALVVVTAPIAWLGATLPGPFGAALLSSTLLLRALCERSASSRTAFAARAAALTLWAVALEPSAAWLAPAALWAVLAHRPPPPKDQAPCRRAASGAWLVAAALGALVQWALWPGAGLLQRTLLAGLGGGPGVLFLWALWLPLGLGFAGLGLFELFAGRRSPEESRPPRWFAAWCLAPLPAILAGSPVGRLPGAALLPAAALGLADWMAREERPEDEGRALRRAALVLAAQVALGALVVAAFVHTDPERGWRELARRELEPSDVVLTTSELHLYLLRHRWHVRAELFPPAFFDARERRWLEETEPELRAAAARGRRVVTDGEREHFPPVVLRFAEEVGARPLGAR